MLWINVFLKNLKFYINLKWKTVFSATSFMFLALFCNYLYICCHAEDIFAPKELPTVFEAQVRLSGFSQRISPPSRTTTVLQMLHVRPLSADNLTWPDTASFLRISESWQITWSWTQPPDPEHSPMILNTITWSWTQCCLPLLRWPELHHRKIFLPPLYQSYFCTLTFVSVRNSNFIWVIVIG